MKMSDGIDKLAKALSLAQAEFKPAIKDSKNPFFKSSYADLTSIWDSCKDALAKHELSITQVGGEYLADHVSVTTVLMHSSGQYISGTIYMKPVKNDPQGVGSCISYARRYGLQSILGITTEDDDGNAATGRTTDYSARSESGRVIGRRAE